MGARVGGLKEAKGASLLWVVEIWGCPDADADLQKRGWAGVRLGSRDW